MNLQNGVEDRGQNAQKTREKNGIQSWESEHVLLSLSTLLPLQSIVLLSVKLYDSQG